MELYHTLPKALDTFISNYLQPNNEFLDQLRCSINQICNFLKESKFAIDQCPVKVIKVIKGGSSGKGTALKKGSDADLVVFFSHFHSFEDQRNGREEMLNKLYENLLQYQKQQSFAFELTMSVPKMEENSSWLNTLTFGLFSSLNNVQPKPRKSLSFHMKSNEDSDTIEFDVLPAYDALGQAGYSHPNSQIYVNLIDLNAKPGEFSTSFTELQRNFVKDSPTKLKNLIRLAKHWYKEYVQRLHKPKLQKGEFLPHKYALELLIIYAWQSSNQKDDFKTAAGFRTLLELVVRYRELWLFWPKYYDFSHPELKRYLTRKLQGPKPIILDPADPTGNMAGNVRWDLVAMEAETCLQQICVQGVVGWDVKPMMEIKITVKLTGGSLLQINCNLFLKVETIKQNIEQLWFNFSPSAPLPAIPADKQILMFNGTILDDSKTLLESEILCNGTIILKDAMDIFIKSLLGHILTFQVRPTDDVSSLKKKVEAVERIHPDTYYLVFDGKILEDNDTLQDYKITEHSEIILTLRLRGGGILSS